MENNLEIYKQKVRQSNDFIESPYAQEFTATELKLFEIAVSACKPEDEFLVETQTNKSYKFTAKELAKLLNTSVSSLSHEAERFSLQIMKKCVHLRHLSADGEVEFKSMSIIPYIEYNKGIFAFELNHKVIPYFIKINSKFTEYSLKYLMDMSSAYAIKLYKLLYQYKNLKVRKFAIVDIRDQFGLNENSYSKYADFKRRVIDFSINQINRITDLHVTYKEIKYGRKVEELEFSFYLKNSIDLVEKEFSDSNQVHLTTENNDIPEGLMPLIKDILSKISPTTKYYLTKYFKLKGKNYIEASINYADINAKTNYDKYLQDTLAKNWAEKFIAELQSKQKQQEKIKQQEQFLEAEKKRKEETRQLKENETREKFNLLTKENKLGLLTELITKISTCSPDKLSVILENQDEYLIAFWSYKNGLQCNPKYTLMLTSAKII